MKIAGKNFDNNLKLMKGEKAYRLDKQMAGRMAAMSTKEKPHYKSHAKNAEKMNLARKCSYAPQTRPCLCLKTNAGYQAGERYTITVASKEVNVERDYSQWGRTITKTEKVNAPVVLSPYYTQYESWKELFNNFKFYKKGDKK